MPTMNWSLALKQFMIELDEQRQDFDWHGSYAELFTISFKDPYKLTLLDNSY
jgi:hypothetical protein